MGCLYRIDFPNQKSYIGVTLKTANQRFQQHARANSRVGFAIRKYGADNTTIKTLVISDDAEYLYELETRAIAAYATRHPSGYNLTSGGEGVVGAVSEAGAKRVSAYRKTAATEASISLRRAIHTLGWASVEKRMERSREVKALWTREDYRCKQKTARKGRKLSDQRKQQIGARSQELWESEEFRKKIASAQQARWAHPGEKERMSALAKGRAGAHGSLMRGKWEDPVYREKMREAFRWANSRPGVKEAKSNRQKARMASEDVRGRLALALCKLKGKAFRKKTGAKLTRRDVKLLRVWGDLGSVFTMEKLLALGFRSRDVERWIHRELVEEVACEAFD